MESNLQSTSSEVENVEKSNSQANKKKKICSQKSSKPTNFGEILNESYAATIERVILNCLAQEKQHSKCHALNAPVSPTQHNNEFETIGTDKTTVQLKRSREPNVEYSGVKTSKKLRISEENNSPKKCKVNKPKQAIIGDKLSAKLEDGKGQTVKKNKSHASDIPSVHSRKQIFVSKKNNLKKTILKTHVSSSKVQALPNDHSLVESEISSTPKKRVLFPKRQSDKKKLSFLDDDSGIPTPVKRETPSKSILVSHDRSKSPKKAHRGRGRAAAFVKQQLQEDSPKKKVKFEMPSTVQHTEFANADSIEAMTELIRQKRIRPPYGQPYSVTGAWYIAAGYLKDLAALLECFEKCSTARFAQFAECWREMNFTQIYRGRQSFKELLEFSEELVVLTKKFLENVHSERRRIGALYTLYSLYYKHPVRQQFFLRFTPCQYSCLAALVKGQPHLVNPDPARILTRLHADSAIHHTAFNTELCVDLHTSYSSSSVCVEYGYLRLAQSSSVPRALTELHYDDQMMREYHNIKVAATTEGGNEPDRALNFFNPACSEQVLEELTQLKDYTLTLLSFRGPHAVHSRTQVEADPTLAVGLKRYEIRKRAASIAAVEAQQQQELLHQLLEGNEPSTPDLDELAKRTLTLAATMPSPGCISTQYVGKMEYDETQGKNEQAKEAESHVSMPMLKPGSPLKMSDNKLFVRNDLGYSFIRRRRGRPTKYLNTKEKTLPPLPLEAAQVSITQKVRRDRLMQKLARRKEVNYSLGVKRFKSPFAVNNQEKSDLSSVVIDLQPANTLVLCGDAERELVQDEYTELADSVGVEANVDVNETSYTDYHNLENNESANADDGLSAQDDTMLDMRIQFFVNNKREQRNIKAKVSAKQFEDIKNDPYRTTKLHEKLLLLILPKLKRKHGAHCEVRDLKIVKARRCKPESLKALDFITGNQPFVKSGICNIRMRMRMMEKFQKKTPVQVKVEQMNEAATAKVKLVPIIVGRKLKYIQSGTDTEHSEKDVVSLPSSVSEVNWENNSVLRSHNCNWTEQRKIAEEFKNFKYQLNVSKLNTVKLEHSLLDVKKENMIFETYSRKRCSVSNVTTYKPKQSLKVVPGERENTSKTSSKRRSSLRLQKHCSDAEANTNIVSDKAVLPNVTPTTTEDNDVEDIESNDPLRLVVEDSNVTSSGGIEIENSIYDDVRRTVPKQEMKSDVNDSLHLDTSISISQIHSDWDFGDEMDDKPIVTVLSDRRVKDVEYEVTSLQDSESRITYQDEIASNDSVHDGCDSPHDVDSEINLSHPDMRVCTGNDALVKAPADSINTSDNHCEGSSLEKPSSEYMFVDPSKEFEHVPRDLLSVDSSNQQGPEWLGNVGNIFLPSVSGTASRNEIKPYGHVTDGVIGFQYEGDSFTVAGLTPTFSSVPLYPPSTLAPVPVLMRPSLPYLSTPSGVYGDGSYIRAHTHDGAELLLPANTFFSIVTADGSETNATELNFNGPNNPIMIRPQPVLHGTAQDELPPPSLDKDQTPLPIVIGKDDGCHLSCSESLPSSAALNTTHEMDLQLRALMAEDRSESLSSSSLLSSPVPCKGSTNKKKLLGSLDLKPSQCEEATNRSSTPVRHSLRRSRRLNTSTRSTPGTPSKRTPVTTPLQMLPNKGSERVGSSGMQATLLQSAEKKPLDISLASTFTPRYSKPQAAHSSSSSPRKPPSITPSSSTTTTVHSSPTVATPSGSTSRHTPTGRSVCSFLLSKSLGALRPALGVAATGAASGRPPTPPPQRNAPRVSFFKKGSLIRENQLMSKPAAVNSCTTFGR